jgi:hypothetical protein
MRMLLTTGRFAAAVLLACSSKDNQPATGRKAEGPAYVATATEASVVTDACRAPTQIATIPEESAWRLFVAAVCPVNADRYPYVVWENWIEQNQLYNPGAHALVAGQRPRFHGSPLRAFLRLQAEAKRVGRKSAIPQGFFESGAQDCATSQFGRVICEETRINPDAQRYIERSKLTTMAGQLAFASAGNAFQFPPPAVEIKADWIRLSSCDVPPSDVHVETVDGACYALAGMHLISKLIDKWIWATFEPQNSATNPRRCEQLGCKDTWGSSPSKTSGAATQLTQGLADLMTSAKIAPEWRNYRLDGVQIDFLDGQTPSVLGNSIIEGENAADPDSMKQSSCITCHQYSTIRIDGKNPMTPAFKIGNPLPLPAGMISRDFLWSLSLAR